MISEKEIKEQIKMAKELKEFTKLSHFKTVKINAYIDTLNYVLGKTEAFISMKPSFNYSKNKAKEKK